MKKLVIFDFDGVLVNTVEFTYSLNKKSNPDMSFEEYSRMAHGNFYKSFESENPTHPSFVQHPTFHDEYREGIREYDTPLVLKQAVEKLSKECILAVVSSGFENPISHYLEKDNLHTFFSDVLGTETHKSKSWKIKHLLDKYSINEKDVVFITDTLGDVLEAHEAGVKSIAVTWGLHTEETLKKGKPASIISDPIELVGTIEKMLK